MTPDFTRLADFAGLGSYEAVAVQETGKAIAPFTENIVEAMSGYLMTRPESAPIMNGMEPPVSIPVMKEWLDRTIAGPFDGELSAFLREVSHVEGKGITFPGVQVPLPPQLILALTGCRDRSSMPWGRPATSPMSRRPAHRSSLGLSVTGVKRHWG
jgi:hypothetical protein